MGRLLKELMNHMQVRKRRLGRSSSWRHQREQLHRDLSNYFSKREQKMNKTQQNGSSRNKSSHRRLLEILFNKELHQRALKGKMQRELLTRFRTVDLKAKICEDIKKLSRTKAHKKQLRYKLEKQPQFVNLDD